MTVEHLKCWWLFIRAHSRRRYNRTFRIAGSNWTLTFCTRTPIPTITRKALKIHVNSILMHRIQVCAQRATMLVVGSEPLTKSFHLFIICQMTLYFRDAGVWVRCLAHGTHCRPTQPAPTIFMVNRMIWSGYRLPATTCKCSSTLSPTTVQCIDPNCHPG